MQLPQFLGETEERVEGAWESAREGLGELGTLLEENGEGPFFMGGVGEFLVLLFLLVEERGGKGSE